MTLKKHTIALATAKPKAKYHADPVSKAIIPAEMLKGTMIIQVFHLNTPSTFRVVYQVDKTCQVH